jgi:hypothetical protein
MIQGEARGVDRVAPTQADPRSVLTFRVERFDDDGNRELLASVEMRGLRITGSVKEGDRVRVLSAKEENGTVVATKVANETTRAVIIAHGWSGPSKWLIGVAVGVFIAITVAAVYLIVLAFSQFDLAM